MGWTVAVLIFSAVAVGPLAGKDIGDQLSYGNGDDLPISNSELISEEEAVRSYPAERDNLSKMSTCENFGGKCISKKGAEMKCTGKVDAKFACSSKKKVCCINGCPEGTFWFPLSNQCFKLTSTRKNWHDAKKECEDAGLVLARPYFPVELREYLVMRYGHNVEAWINARGNGKIFVWQNNGDFITPDNPRWWPDQPGEKVTTNNCLLLRAREDFWRAQPVKPLYSFYCSTLKIFALCEWELK